MTRNIADDDTRKDTPSLFVWRDMVALKTEVPQRYAYPDALVHAESDAPIRDMILNSPLYDPSDFYLNPRCPYCGTRLAGDDKFKDDAFRMVLQQLFEYRCEFCGFWNETHDFYTPDGDEYTRERNASAALLRRLHVDSDDLALSELGSHLRRRYTDVYSISPRRFEELVADVFSNLGLVIQLTKQTRDGGADIVLLEGSSDRQAIVECKRYAPTRHVSVGIVRQLAGVQLITGIDTAFLVTTSSFTQPSKEAVKTLNKGMSKYHMELIDSEALLEALGVYNVALPPLHLQLKDWSKDR